MKGSRESRSSAKGEWYFVHALAAITIAEVVLLASIDVYFSLANNPVGLSMPLGVVVGTGAITLLWFWVRMLTDYFRQRPPTHQAAWGWFLFLGAYVGGLAYFFSVWRPRHRLDDA